MLSYIIECHIKIIMYQLVAFWTGVPLKYLRREVAIKFELT